MNPVQQFKQDVAERINENRKNSALIEAGAQFVQEATKCQYTYNFSWLGRPIIQYPQDMIGVQELIWGYKPDLIIETGIAHGGSLIFYASLLKLMGDHGKVIGIDIDIRDHNQVEIESHLLADRIIMIEGSSIASEIIDEVKVIAQDYKKVMLILDSCHTTEHVYNELRAYSELITEGGYIVVFDTVVNELPEGIFGQGKEYTPQNNPKLAIDRFIKEDPSFEIVREFDSQTIISSLPGGLLKKKSLQTT